jgi:hypothetical protein
MSGRVKVLFRPEEIEVRLRLIVFVQPDGTLHTDERLVPHTEGMGVTKLRHLLPQSHTIGFDKHARAEA